MIHLIWLDNIKNDWIRYLLSNIDYKETDILGKMSILVISNDPKKYTKYFDECERLKYKFVLIHLNDKYYMHNTDIYDSESCKLVIRTYYTPDYENNLKVIFIPIGYGSVPKQDLPVSVKRKYSWSFSGSIKDSIIFDDKSPRHPLLLDLYYNQRVIIFDKLIKNNDEYYFSDDIDSLTIDGYEKVLLQTVFSICPMSDYNIDTRRLYESLESGCIPVVPYKTVYQNYCYYDKLFNCEVPFIKTEAGFRNFVPMIDNNSENLRLKIYEWWEEYRYNLREKITNKIKKIKI